MTEQTGLTVLEEDQMVLPPRPEFSANAYIKSMEEYEALYKRSIEDPNGFWAEIAEKELTWFKKWDKVLDYDFNKPYIKWFQGGKLNASYNCLDRHLDTWRKNKAAIIWEADDGTSKTYTYQQLHREVNRFANVLKKKGVKRGDRVSLYLPMIPELAIAMLACARIGAIHSVVFGGFSSQALRDRIQDCEAKVLVVADNGMRGGRVVPLKKNSDAALEQCPSIQSVIVVNRAGDTEMKEGRDTWWHEEMAANDISSYCEPEHMDAEDPLFILYTSGSTGKPKGVLHTTGGYTLYTALTFRLTFDYKEEQTHFCTADIGWVTGHSYVVYGPLTCGATSIMFEGVPSYPDAGRFWDIIDKYQVNIFYTAPTAIRALMKEGDGWVEKYDLSSLKVLGTVGEPINPAAFMWYYNKVGKSKLPIVDTYWQTETGGFLITPLPGAMTLKPGSATRPFFGVEPKVVKEDGSPAPVDEQGYLVIDKPWPGMLRGTYGDPENARIKEVYFSRFPGKYFTGDGARVDRDGDFWITGRIDDVINVSGHRLGTAEVESALVSHPSVAEAAVVGFPHDIKGEGIYAYVTLKDGFKPSPELKKELVTHVRTIIGPIASPDKMQFAPGLPKTRSGKIMRRILRKIAHNEISELGDISTLADPSVVESLIKERL
ncbi:MAG: acetate--CoA ligase [Candidatus Aquicultor secundus]|uniref:Acetyl-coenzyme A synthetase n=1 Tax=Candidatus Aquicultor secundus TaxID=1973895 RepID=A0A2M7T8Q8_9ACTN|nr:acetate--CoA ligase [Candidatus Aquicultor secundus]NCO65154.1 acetate--CoA ligase [Solirubrobacter sp.]OIO87027.1 MAG: acetate--CoA ligase [Candidatus Aquicultor secundus]PIU28098.1 MAG: acetate--CoA ligase [Candidatus Aquicultor secundus]PIX52798.1 MAG: acetate--CoA ligase [Candidatus Aquicultor secundus]PIY40985.1 MAG: acetate--CoA ligase [Candidatus Aquicultor secundus]